MKKVFALLLTLALLLPTVLSVGTVAGAEDVGVTPFVGIGWSEIDNTTYPNMFGYAGLGCSIKKGVAYVNNANTDEELDKAVAEFKKQMDALPEGMRYAQIFGMPSVLSYGDEDLIYMDFGANLMAETVARFMDKYAAAGGKLDGIYIDLEYENVFAYELHTRVYLNGGKPNKTSIYNDMVNNPKYATDVRPLLEERNFPFYENPSGDKSELWSITPGSGYTGADMIWNAVARYRLNQYMNTILLEPLLKHFPNATMSDYQSQNIYGWYKELSGYGGADYLGGNGSKAGNTSNSNFYTYEPWESFYNTLYNSPPAYNKAVFEKDHYNMFLWDANRAKNMYASTDTKLVNFWIAGYDYHAERPESTSNTPYYTETVLHLGMLDPKPFLLYIYRGEYKSDAEYIDRIKVAGEILSELTRVVGASDRKPIETPSNWNNAFVLSGMYAGGKNIWRITPDTTDGMTKEAFKVSDSDPTFSINGQTITFPGGKIIADGEISAVGTCGYWVETAANVTPIVVNDADRYQKYPSYAESFEGYADGANFTVNTAKPAQTWEVKADTILHIRQNGDSKALALTDTATLKHKKLPAKITAGDSYAKQQAWEISFTLPASVTGTVKLLSCAENDGGIKIEGGALYYDKAGAYEQFADLTLTAGEKYTVKREMNFTGEAFTSSYTVYDATGKVVAQANDVPMVQVALPVKEILFSCADLTDTVFIDDYKLYPIGITTDLEIYNANTGIKLDSEETYTGDIAFRLSWLNGSADGKTATVMVQYGDAEPQVVRTIAVAPGCDAVDTGIVENKDGVAVRLSVQLTDGLPEPPPVVIPTDPTVAPTNPADIMPGVDGGNGSTVAIIAVIALVVAAAAVGVLLYLKKKKTKS